MSSIDLAQARHNMVEQQVRPWDVLDSKVLDILERMPRDAFTPEAYQGLAYADTKIPLGNGHFMMHPILEGRLLQALDLQPEDRVLEIGTGSGYLTACLAKLADHVDSVEIDRELASRAGTNLLSEGATNVALIVADGVKDFDTSQKYDAIAVTGSMVALPDKFREALNVGGRLFVILGEDPAMQAHLITRTDESSWSDQILFETSVKALDNAGKPKQFVF